MIQVLAVFSFWVVMLIGTDIGLSPRIYSKRWRHPYRIVLNLVLAIVCTVVYYAFVAR